MAHIPLREIRLHLGRIQRAALALKEIQDSIPLPPDAELEDMVQGKVPPSEEAYVTAILQSVLLRLTDDADRIREDLHQTAISNPSVRWKWRCHDSDIRSLLRAVQETRKWRDRKADRHREIEA
ncbi:MAG TPA: hypothetical protein VHC97_20210 [Thermoanaerobaculia bacterium]|jgi:hypothetical protein|nr:hypothetical protein [Thermoanaerobaculia bacterium]